MYKYWLADRLDEALAPIPGFIMVPLEKALKWKWGITVDNVWDVLIDTLEHASDEDIDRSLRAARSILDKLDASETPADPAAW
jgi:hypothetical protein